MSSTNLNIGINTAANLGGLNQTVAAINQVTAAQQRQAQAQARSQAQSQQGTGAAQQFSGGVLGGLGVPTSIGAVVSSTIGFAKVLTDTAGRTRDLSDQLNLTTTQFQHLERGASEAGVPLGKLIASLGRMDQQRQAAAEGSEKLRSAFAAVGVSLADLNNPTLQAIDLQQRLAKATENGSEAQRAAVRAILGAQGARLLPAFAAAAALAEKDAASPAALERVDAFGKFWERTWGKIKREGIEAFAALNEGAEKFLLKVMGGKPTPDPRPDLRRDTKEYDEQIASGRSEGAVTGGAKRVRDFKLFRDKSFKDQTDAGAAEQVAKRDESNAADKVTDLGVEQLDLSRRASAGETLSAAETKRLRELPALIAAAKVAQDGFGVAVAKAQADGNRSARDYALSYEDFAVRPPAGAPAPSAGEPLFEDVAANARKLEVDKLLTENAEKRRKLEFDQLTPAQKRADIEKRIADNKLAQDEAGYYEPKLKAELEGKGLDLQGDLGEMEKSDKGTFKTPADQFQKMGGFIGNAAVDTQQDSAREGVKLARETKAAIDLLPGRIVAAGAGNIQPVRITQ